MQCLKCKARYGQSPYCEGCCELEESRLVEEADCHGGAVAGMLIVSIVSGLTGLFIGIGIGVYL